MLHIFLTFLLAVFSLSAFAQSTTEMNALAFKAFHMSDENPRAAFKMLEAESKKPGFEKADSARIIFAAMHQTGIGTLPDSKKAMRIWKEEADKGSSWAASFLSIEYATKAYLNKTEKAEAFRYTEMAAEDHPFSKYRLGTFYFWGKYVKKDKEKGVELLKSAAMDGEPHACLQVGDMYKFGMNVDLSKSTAFQLYQSAAEQDHVPAYMKLYECYKEGIGTRQSYPNAVQMLDKAIAGGDVEALYQKGEAYRQGTLGMEKDENKAKQYLQRAADQKHSGAAQSLAAMNRPPPITGMTGSGGNGAGGGMTYDQAVLAYEADLEANGYQIHTEGKVDRGSGYKMKEGGYILKCKLVLIVNEGTRPGYYPTFKTTFYNYSGESLGYFVSTTNNLTRLTDHLTAVEVTMDIPSGCSYYRVEPRASGYFYSAGK